MSKTQFSISHLPFHIQRSWSYWPALQIYIIFVNSLFRNFKHQIGTKSNTQIKMGTSINYATFKELLTNSMDPTVQRKIRPEHKLQTRSIKSLSTRFVNKIHQSCERSLLNALKSGKNTSRWRVSNLWGKPGVWLLGKGYFQQTIQMSEKKKAGCVTLSTKFKSIPSFRLSRSFSKSFNRVALN